MYSRRPCLTYYHPLQCLSPKGLVNLYVCNLPFSFRKLWLISTVKLASLMWLGQLMAHWFPSGAQTEMNISKRFCDHIVSYYKLGSIFTPFRYCRYTYISFISWIHIFILSVYQRHQGHITTSSQTCNFENNSLSIAI